jgi:LuxR family maltose regulon positive regulatory protein
VRLVAVYVDRLLDGWRTLYKPGVAPTRGAAIADSLTPRENGILQLIADGRLNNEIAKSLSIAPEMLKSHVKNIFGELSVKKRAQAHHARSNHRSAENVCLEIA